MVGKGEPPHIWRLQQSRENHLYFFICQMSVPPCPSLHAVLVSIHGDGLNLFKIKCRGYEVDAPERNLFNLICPSLINI